MPSKFIVTDVRCINEWADSASSFIAEIPEALVARIMVLSRLPVRHEIYSTCEFNYAGLWSNLILDVDDVSEDQLPSVIKAMSADDMNVRVDTPMLHVMEKEFRWTAVPKHGGDDLEICTPPIPLSFLEGDEVLYAAVE